MRSSFGQEMEVTTTTPRDRLRHLFWWVAWSFAFIASLLPITAHHTRRIEELIEPFRFAGMLLPGPLLMLGWFDELAALVPGGLMTALLVSFWRPAFRKELFGAAIGLAAVFFALYASYCVLLISLLLTDLAAPRQLRQPAEQAAPSDGDKPTN